jgi:hypothetical protein
MYKFAVLCVEIAMCYATYAQEPNPADKTQPATSSADTGEAWNPVSPSRAVPPHAKTRAEVYQELIDAQRTGELKKLDSTVYQGG